MDLGVLLSLPVESIAIRAIVATVACVALVKIALRIGIKSPGVRVIAAALPAVALIVVLIAASADPRLPTVMLPVDARDALAIRVAEGYLYFAPIVFPLLVAAWAAFAAFRLLRRILMVRQVHRRAFEAVASGSVPHHVRVTATAVARRLGVAEPRITVVPRAPGGAYVVGSRRPVVVLDEALVGRLDECELEGVLAHELAHVKRHDNLVSGALGVVRDAMFFAPGAGWAVRHLHRERELAADQAAVAITGKPGALASGLLKVLEMGPREGHACAAFAPSSGLVDRVRVLVDDAPAPTAARRTVELALLAVVVCAAVVAALVVPSQVAGSDRQRDAVAIVWSAAAPGEMPATTRARALDVYERNSLSVPSVASAATALHDERAIENRRSTLRACAPDNSECPAPEHQLGLGLRPRPTITINDDVVRSWQATPVMDGVMPGGGIKMYWLSRAG